MKDMLIIFLLKGVLGYLMQLSAMIIGMHAISRHRIEWWKVAVVSVLCAALTSLLRSVSMIQFGVHTLLTCLILNVACIFVCKMDINKSVMGSIIMTILTLLSDVINFAFIMPFMNMDTGAMQVFLQNETNKALSALPGNFTLMFVVLLMYCIRVKKRAAT